MKFPKMILLTGALLLSSVISASAYNNQFTDVPTNRWCYSSVRDAYDFGLIAGTSSTTFSPQSNVKRVEAVAFAARVHALLYQDPIEDYGYQQ